MFLLQIVYRPKRQIKYSKTGVKWPVSKRSKLGFQDQLSLNTGQNYCIISAILSTFIKLPFVISIFVLSFMSGSFTQVLLYS